MKSIDIKTIKSLYDGNAFLEIREKLGFDIRDLITDQNTCVKMSMLTERYGISRSTIYKLLKAVGKYQNNCGINGYNSGIGKLICSKTDLESMLDSGLVTKDIALKLSVHPSTITKLINKYGIIENQRSWAASKSFESKNGNLKLLKDRDWLYDLYVTQNMSSKAIGDLISVSDGTVLKALNANNIKVVVDGEHQIRCDNLKDVLEKLRDKNWLTHQYCDLKLTAQQIADNIKCTQRLVLIYLKKHDIDMRSSLYYNSIRKPSEVQMTLERHLTEMGKIIIPGWVYDGVYKSKRRKFEIDIYLPDDKIFIEVQGEHWHGLNQRHWKYQRVRSKMWSDLIKYLCVTRDYKDHVLVYISEDDINKDKYQNKLNCLNHNEQSNNFVKNDYAIVLGKYDDYMIKNHYLHSNVGHLQYGLFHLNELIAAASFGNLIRQNTKNKNDGKTLELKRLVSTNDRKNILSFFLSRCIKQLKNIGITKVVSYADISPVRKGEHSGGVYRAANFKYVGKTQHSYFYWNEELGCVHKKTIYNRAKKNGLNEKEYVESIGLHKLPEWPKHKFEYEIR